MKAPQCVWNARAALGEGPLWSVKEQALYWVDILKHRLHRFAPNEQQAQRTWQFNQEISAVAERAEAGGLIVSLRHGFAFFDPATEKLQPLAQIESELPGNRFKNKKSKTHNHNRAGTMDFDGKQPSGSLYRFS